VILASASAGSRRLSAIENAEIPASELVITADPCWWTYSAMRSRCTVKAHGARYPLLGLPLYAPGTGETVVRLDKENGVFCGIS
jgi:hypothetical protein